ncbi:MAG: lipoyl(octanoyl) transferase LipB [Chitinophagaceae bacterium]|jgi:lipoyl(octanoyl) transferase|nr:lipoyl(octanoyl) transferase LipB [Chitinophagaceae bacterium]
MQKQPVLFTDLGFQRYKPVWDLQEKLLAETVSLKTRFFDLQASERPTLHRLLLVEHPPVYTLGKSGHLENMLITEDEMHARGIDYFKINRGGDITFHGPQQLVGYPILDLEKFYTDIGRYLRSLEEVIIRTLAHFGIAGSRSQGETGVWIDPDIKGKERKICAMGVRTSRWVTMHGWALNVNTDLSYFDNIIPCGIRDKQVTSMKKELGYEVDFTLVKNILSRSFEEVFDVELVNGELEN